jgi:hypothetical protein
VYFQRFCLPIILLWGLVACAFSAQIDSEFDQYVNNAPNGEKFSVIIKLHSPRDIAALDQELHVRKALLAERHILVERALRANAEETQGPVLAKLERWKKSGEVDGYTAYWIENLIVFYGTVEVINDLKNDPAVSDIGPNFEVDLIEPVARGPIRQLRPEHLDTELTTPGQNAIGATRVNRELGITGLGVLVANCDTGVDGNHPALASRWRGAGGAHPWQQCWNDVLNTTQFPTAGGSHGTHVMGTITGRAINGNDTITVGSAPRAQWIAARTIDQGHTIQQMAIDVVAAFQWFMNPDGDVNTTDDVPDVLQNSWGVTVGHVGTPCYTFWNTVILNLEAGGTVVTWSAGNEGPQASSHRSPATFSLSATTVFSVGAVDATNDPTPPYLIASFSSRGPTTCTPAVPNNIKPEIAAPGVDVYSSVPGNGYQQDGWDGTSMAGPHVAGVVALMREACPNCDPQTIKEAILNTAIDYGTAGDDNTYGMGFINAYAAVMTVSSLGRLDGFVTDNNNAPLQGVHVQAVGENPFAITGANGYYMLMANEGLYTIRYEKFGYNTVVVPDVQTVEGDTTHLDVIMTPAAAGVLAGLVQIQTGVPISNAEVIIRNTPLDTILTNAQGRFVVALPATNYQINVRIMYNVGTLLPFSLDTNITVVTGDTTRAVLTVIIPQLEPLGPDTYGYLAYDRADRDLPATYDWVELAPYPPDFGPGIPFTFANQDSAVFFRAPFPLRFYGQTYDSLTVNCNGWMLPGVHPQRGPSNTQIPNVDTNGPHGIIAPYWDNFRNGSGAERWQWYDEENGRWIFEFTTEQLASPSQYLFFWQVHFYDPAIHPTRTGDGQIVFIYQSVPFDERCTVGIENPQENTGLMLLFNDSLYTHAFPIRDSSAVRFTTGAPTQFGTVQGTLTTNPPAGNIGTAQIRIGGRNVSPNASGQFSITSVPVGTLTAVLSLNGYEPRRVGQVQVTPSGTTTLNFDAWRLDPPLNLSAGQNSGVIYLSWNRPQSVAMFPAPWVRYSVTCDGTPIASSLTDTTATDTLAADQSAVYRVIAVYRNGHSEPSDSVQITVDLATSESNSLLPREFALEQNYPNPFNPSTNIRLAIPMAVEGSLRVFDITGRLVQTIAAGQFTAGYHTYSWKGDRVASGVYFYRFTSDRFTETRKMLLVK